MKRTKYICPDLEFEYLPIIDTLVASPNQDNGGNGDQKGESGILPDESDDLG